MKSKEASRRAMVKVQQNCAVNEQRGCVVYHLRLTNQTSVWRQTKLLRVVKSCCKKQRVDVLYATIQFRNLQQLICCKIGLIRGW